jgi:hypothetical protein
MDISDKLQEILSSAEQIRQHGFKDMDTESIGRLLGVQKSWHFENQATKAVDIGLWLLTQVSDTAINEQKEFIARYIFPRIEPGEIPEIEILNEILEQKKIKESNRQEAIDFFVNGVGLNELNISRSGLTGFVGVLEGIKSEYLHKKHESFSFTKIVSRLSRLAKRISPKFMVVAVTQSSRSRIKELERGECFLTLGETALLHLLSLLPQSKYTAFEDMILEMVSRIERFRYENFVLVRKLYPMIIENAEKGTKPPFWLGFFDHEVRAKSLSLAELFNVYSAIVEIEGLSEKEVRLQLEEFYGENSRVRFLKAKEYNALAESQGLTLSQVYHKMNPDMDIALFYRTMKKWKREWEYNDYWQL